MVPSLRTLTQFSTASGPVPKKQRYHAFVSDPGCAVSRGSFKHLRTFAAPRRWKRFLRLSLARSHPPSRLFTTMNMQPMPACPARCGWRTRLVPFQLEREPGGNAPAAVPTRHPRVRPLTPISVSCPTRRPRSTCPPRTLHRPSIRIRQDHRRHTSTPRHWSLSRHTTSPTTSGSSSTA